MFSAGFHNESMVISAIGATRISFQNVEELRKTIIQILHNPCDKIILDLSGIRFIDSQSFATIGHLYKLAERKKVAIAFANVDDDVKELFELIPEASNYRIEELVESYEMQKKPIVA